MRLINLRDTVFMLIHVCCQKVKDYYCVMCVLCFSPLCDCELCSLFLCVCSVRPMVTQFLSMPVEVEPRRTVTNGMGVTLRLTVRADTLPTMHVEV